MEAISAIMSACSGPMASGGKVTRLVPLLAHLNLHTYIVRNNVSALKDVAQMKTHSWSQHVDRSSSPACHQF